MDNEQQQGGLPSVGVVKAIGSLTKKFITGVPLAALGGPVGLVGGALFVLVFFVLIPIFIIVVLSLSLGGGEISTVGPTSVEAAPIPGDDKGLLGDYCTRIPVVPPPYPDNPAIPGKDEMCSAVLKNLFESAAVWSRVPAGVIAGVAAIEGKHMFGYTDDEIRRYSATSGGTGIDGQAIDPLNSTPNICGAVGPMQFLIDRDPDYPAWLNNCRDEKGNLNLNVETTNVWTSGGEPTRYKDAVNLAFGAGLTNPDARNIRNAIYGAAWKLKCDSGVPADECARGEFTKYDYDDSDNRWEGPPGEDGEADGGPGEVWRAAERYYGSCAKNYCQNVWEYYNAIANFGATGAAWGWPTTGTITQGPYQDPSHQDKSAMDIAFPGGGKPVYATSDGQMFKLNEPGGCGTYVVIFGTQYDTYYCHLESYSPCLAALPNNSFLKTGTYLGKMGWSGDVRPKSPDGAHLHYAIKTAGENSRFLPIDEFNSLLPVYKIWDSVTASYSGEACEGEGDISGSLVFNGSWTEDEKKTVIGAVSVPVQSAAWRNLVFAKGKITLTRQGVDPSDPEIVSGYAASANELYIYDPFFTGAGRTFRGRVFIITHEMTHIIQQRNASVFDAYKASSAFTEYKTKSVVRSYPLCSGNPPVCKGVNPENEDFAEMAGNYVSDRDGAAIDFPNEYPEHYKFAKDTLFGGSSF